MKKSTKLGALAGVLLGGAIYAFGQAVISLDRELSNEYCENLKNEGRLHMQFIDDNGKLIEVGNEIKKEGSE